MTIYLLSAEAERDEADRIERRLRPALPDLKRIGSIEEIIDLAPVSAAPACVLFVAPAQGGGYFRALLDMAARHRHRFFFILLGAEISVDEYKALVRTGGADWVSLGADPKEILDILARQERRGRQETGGTGAGLRVPLAVALVPGAGGVGNATIAAETAAYLKTGKATRVRDVCIVDLDFQSSHICDHL